jgi:BolA-like protein 1
MLAFTGAAAAAVRSSGSAYLGRRLSCGLRSLPAPRCSPHAAAAAPRMMCTASDTVMATVERKISAALSPTRLVVTPAYGDPNGSHVSIHVVSAAFAGMGVVARHRLVYKAIWEELQGPIHAVDELVTKTPEEVQ